MTHENPSPDQIESEISATRAGIDQKLDALQQKLSPGEILDQALSYAKEGGGEFAANFGRTIRDNPVPVTLLGLSAGWLMFAGRSPAPEAYRPSAAPGPRYTAADTEPPPPPGVQTATASDFRTARPTTGPSDGKHAAGDKASNLGKGVKKTLDSAEEKLGEIRDEVGDRAVSAYEQAEDYAKRTGQSIAEGTASVKSFMNENPLVAGVLAMAAGAAIGAMLPPTRQEDKAVGTQSKAVKESAEEVVAANLDKAKGAVRKTRRAVSDEIKPQPASISGTQKPLKADPRPKSP